jgi:ribosome-associated protein YbcJ (S4-like RNA binding protein)
MYVSVEEEPGKLYNVIKSKGNVSNGSKEKATLKGGLLC